MEVLDAMNWTRWRTHLIAVGVLAVFQAQVVEGEPGPPVRRHDNVCAEGNDEKETGDFGDRLADLSLLPPNAEKCVLVHEEGCGQRGQAKDIRSWENRRVEEGEE